MKINFCLIILIALLISSCQGRQGNLSKSVISISHQKETKSDESSHVLELPHIEVYESSFPIRLDEINFDDRNKIVQISDGKIFEIEEVVKKFYFQDCSGDSAETYLAIKDVY